MTRPECEDGTYSRALGASRAVGAAHSASVPDGAPLSFGNVRWQCPAWRPAALKGILGVIALATLVLIACNGWSAEAQAQSRPCCTGGTGFASASIGPGIGHRGSFGAGDQFTSVMGYFLEAHLGLFVLQRFAITVGTQFKATGWGFQAEGGYLGGSLGVLGLVGDGISVHGQIGVGSIHHEWTQTDYPFHIRAIVFPALSGGVSKMWKVTESVLLGIGLELTYYYYYDLTDDSVLGFVDEATAGERSEVDLSVYFRMAFEFSVW